MIIFALPFFLPALVLIFTPNNKKAVWISMAIITAIASMMIFHIFAYDISAAMGDPYKLKIAESLKPDFRHQVINSILRVAGEFYAVFIMAVFFKYLALTSSIEDAKYLSIFGLSGPILLAIAPSPYPWIMFSLFFLLLVLSRLPRTDQKHPITKT